MHPEQTAGTIPVHHQIANDLRSRIVSGELGPGAEVPSVKQLVDQWRCSPGVARNALAVLASEGRITGGRGRRARVRTPPRRIKLTIDMTQEQKSLVLRPRSERAARGTVEQTAGVSIDHTGFSARYTEIRATEELASEFGVEVNAELLCRTYETTDQNGVRLAWSISHIPLDLIKSNPDLRDESKEPWPGGHMHQLYTVGIEIERLVRSVTAIEPTPGDRQRWGMDLGVPLLCVHTRSVDIDGRTVEISDATYPADRTGLVFTESLERWPTGHPAFDPETDG